jgi:hypothetical protein
MQPTSVTSEAHSHAEVLLWQGRYRAIFLPLIGFATITLKWFGVVSASSLFAPRYGERSLLLVVALMLASYLLFHRLMAFWLRRTGRAGMGTVIAAIASDMVVLFAIVALVTPPEHYDRALIFFGWSATIANLVLVAIGYTTLVALAADYGGRISPNEELWTLALYGIGVLVYVALQGHVAKRMRRLEYIFTRAQEGDFSGRFDEDPDQMPDPISGCFNRRGLNQLAEREVSRAVRGKKEMAVLGIDVDHFKRINDDYGHLTGDEVIRLK